MSEGINNGDYLKILATPIDVIMNIWNYINFKNEYEKEMHLINTQQKD